ncbi:MAG: hypothetical protein FWC00_00215 [Firmicutes bacterium]|nr:hypothetical protein [Bacillota bacterium]
MAKVKREKNKNTAVKAEASWVEFYSDIKVPELKKLMLARRNETTGKIGKDPDKYKALCKEEDKLFEEILEGIKNNASMTTPEKIKVLEQIDSKDSPFELEHTSALHFLKKKLSNSTNPLDTDGVDEVDDSDPVGTGREDFFGKLGSSIISLYNEGKAGQGLTFVEYRKNVMNALHEKGTLSKVAHKQMMGVLGEDEETLEVEV